MFYRSLILFASARNAMTGIVVLAVLCVGYFGYRTDRCGLGTLFELGTPATADAERKSHRPSAISNLPFFLFVSEVQELLELGEVEFCPAFKFGKCGDVAEES